MDGSTRFEYMDQGVPMVQIFDISSNQMIWLDTEKKVYTKRELADSQAMSVTGKAVAEYNPCDEFPDAKCHHLKSAEMNGRQTDKWLLTFSDSGKDRHVFQWVDQEHQILVRQENPDGSVLDVNILDDQEIDGRKVRKVEMLATSADGSRVHGARWYDAELDIVVRQYADNGAINELRNIRIETVAPELFAIPGDYRLLESQFTDLDRVPAQIGTANN